MSFKLPDILKIISKELYDKGAKAIVVGGSVRDYYLGFEIKDYDVEVYGLDTLESLSKLLGKYGSVNLVGKSFGVLKFKYDGDEYDFSFPRVEFKVGDTHKSFDVVVDPKMDFKDASKRRDFTINAMGYDIQNLTFLDAYDGLADIKTKTLRHIDDKTFQEDALRVYRGIGFCARFEFKFDEKTFKLCKNMVDADMLKTLPKERVFDEIKKLLLKSKKPSLGFKIMQKLGVFRYFDELKSLCVDDFNKSINNIDMLKNKLDAQVDADEKTKLIYMFASLCSGFKTLELCESFISKLSDEKEFLKRVLILVKYHKELDINNLDDRGIRVLATKVQIYELLGYLKFYMDVSFLKERAKKLGVYEKPLKNLIQGRDLISLGMKPSEKFKEILDSVYEMHLSGNLTTKKEALDFISSNWIEYTS